MSASDEDIKIAGNKEEYLKILEKLKKIRYFNVRRSGTIVCRECKIQSKTPGIHVEHVNIQHKHLRGFCPYCQKERIFATSQRMSKQTKNHLKVCCFFHKIENSKVRKIFNNIKIDTSMQSEREQWIVKTSVLTLQRLVNSSQFLLNVLQYELQTNTDNQLCQQIQQKSPILQQACNLSVSEQTQPRVDIYLKTHIAVISKFHREYTLNDSRSPSWWNINYSEVHNIETLIANNKLEFAPSENIDCKLMRIMSLHWGNFNAFKYTINYEDFVTNIDSFQNCILQDCFVITRYMNLFKDNKDGKVKIAMILIAKTKDCFYFCNELIGVAAKIYRITNFDIFVDICFDLSNKSNGISTFLPIENLQLYDLNYNNDVLMPERQTVTISNDINAEIKTGLNVFFSPVRDDAKLYFYSQTKYGCVRVFDRIFQKNNLANLITDIIHDSGNFYIYYSSLKLDENIPILKIELKENEAFANEIQYRRMDSSFHLQSLSEKKLFFIDPENIKIVMEKDSRQGFQFTGGEEITETTSFPHCLISSNIRYKLTQEQATMFKVVQYHREKLLLEMNNIPQIDIC